MIARALIETSHFTILSRKVRDRCSFIKCWADRIYGNSRTHSLFEKVRCVIKVYFSGSFFGKVAEISGDKNFQILNGSRFVSSLSALYGRLKEIFIRYLTNSESANLSEEVRGEFRNITPKEASVIAIIAITVNIALLIFLNKEISASGWFARIAILLVGLGGIFRDIEWKQVKETSIIVRKTKDNTGNRSIGTQH